MESQLCGILGKPSDYKICKKCGSINWYENEECVCNSTDFKESEEDVIKWCNDEYDFWMKEEGYSESEADMVLLDI